MVSDNTSGWYSNTQVDALLPKILRLKGLQVAGLMGSGETRLPEPLSGKVAVCNTLVFPGMSTAQLLSTFLRQEKALHTTDRPDVMLIPMVVNDNHFVGLAFKPDPNNPRGGLCAYSDSLGQPMPPDIRGAIWSVYPDAKTKKIIGRTDCQLNGSDCGPLVIDNLKRLAVGGLQDMETKFREVDPGTVQILREHHQRLLQSINEGRARPADNDSSQDRSGRTDHPNIGQHRPGGRGEGTQD